MKPSDVRKGVVVMDIGCGAGCALTQAMAVKNVKLVVGVEIDHDSVNEAIHKMKGVTSDAFIHK
jgi:tRNA G46 methylase TrmB